MSNDNTVASATEVAPYAGSVLYLIYGVDGDGATSYEIDNGAVATFWGGQHFDLDGRHYYTGFAYATPNKYGNDEAETFPDPGVGVSISQATFLLTAPGTERPWMLFHAQQYVGTFGGYERADTFDDTRAWQSFVLSNGHLLLAVATSSFSNGVTSNGFALFTFDPNKNDLGDYQGWVYRGTLAAGEDNGPSSDEEGGVPHVVSTGILSVTPDPAATMPALQVVLQGTVIAGPGKTRMLDATDIARYRYDQASGQYLPM
ncbi:hypothetical protein [Xanthomonas hortorum]|uniref:Uncharacterized protein n=1 Tax=Xanthomonas hortorum pv. pelargonii TaxID=453602 RepID=A0A6V7EUZ2_9XANT|nr:hypothetical protein [Xanthomonas hortorum]MCE4355884.1 hypothetical protein [Xanthomonas hortorum pv. pelargonii]MCM5525837.1 hypothetical protein [Xanthomonas hortorum pv. pelargonii]MCM5538168.1 hypothetical protein [Xanthomonas hortorum pv. pelargonii]MCM5542368.1 hypothetical protein [Xanthomonas hortorum pv. pelargonii]MCM5545963.1 hypothetical protein [Xanthomonas hortorum pv. pelargonii]